VSNDLHHYISEILAFLCETLRAFFSGSAVKRVWARPLNYPLHCPMKNIGARLRKFCATLLKTNAERGQRPAFTLHIAPFAKPKTANKKWARLQTKNWHSGTG